VVKIETIEIIAPTLSARRIRMVLFMVLFDLETSALAENDSILTQFGWLIACHVHKEA
jgi:hypothetical protein